MFPDIHTHVLCIHTHFGLQFRWFSSRLWKGFFMRSVEFLRAVSYVSVPPMFSFAYALFYSPNSLKSRTGIISRGREIIVSV